MKKIAVRSMTLLEIMIVIFLIGIIGSVLAVNMRGAMEKGRVFKTEQAIRQVRDVLLLEVAKRELSLSDVVKNPLQYLKESGLVRNPEDLIKDGWGEMLTIKVDKKNNDLSIFSKRLAEYYHKQGKEGLAQIFVEDEEAFE